MPCSFLVGMVVMPSFSASSATSFTPVRSISRRSRRSPTRGRLGRHRSCRSSCCRSCGNRPAGCPTGVIGAVGQQLRRGEIPWDSAVARTIGFIAEPTWKGLSAKTTSVLPLPSPHARFCTTAAMCPVPGSTTAVPSAARFLLPIALLTAFCAAAMALRSIAVVRVMPPRESRSARSSGSCRRPDRRGFRPGPGRNRTGNRSRRSRTARSPVRGPARSAGPPRLRQGDRPAPLQHVQHGVAAVSARSGCFIGSSRPAP